MRSIIRTPEKTLPAKKTSLLLAVVTWAFISAGVTGLNGCALSGQARTAAAKDGTQVAAVSHDGMSPDFVYKYLAGEVAGQRGDMGTSGAIFYELARAEKDARLAERAAKIATYGNVPGLAIPAIKLWAELDPTSSEAQQAVTETLIVSGKLSEAEPFLAKLLAKEETRAGGFLYLNNLLARSNDRAGVLKLIQKLAKPYPHLAEAHLAVAQAAWLANKDDVALKALDQVEALHPAWGVAVLLKGQVLYRQSPREAIDFYRHFLEQQPDVNEVRVNYAKLLVAQKQYAEAKKEFSTILEVAKRGDAGNLADMTAIVGLLAYQSADYVAAETYFKQALMLGFKETDQLYIHLGQTAEKLQQDRAAAAWYKQVLPGQRYLEAQISLANVTARIASVDAAIEQLDALDDLSTEQQIIVIQSQAALLTKEKRNEEAFELLHGAVVHMPNTPDLVYDYALAAERLGKFDLMESELRRAIAEKPDFAAAYNALGYSFADRNIRLNEAIRLIEKALSLSPNDHYMLDSLGWAHYRKGSLDKALKYLQQAYDINPDPEIAAHLGEVLWLKGQHDEAKKIWGEALTLHPDNEVLISTANKFRS